MLKRPQLLCLYSMPGASVLSGYGRQFPEERQQWWEKHQEMILPTGLISDESLALKESHPLVFIIVPPGS